MANLDTRSKRASSVGILLSFILSPTLPDGTIAQADRQHAAWSYSGIATTVVTEAYTASLFANITPSVSLFANITPAAGLNSNITPAVGPSAQPSPAINIDANPTPAKELDSG